MKTRDSKKAILMSRMAYFAEMTSLTLIDGPESLVDTLYSNVGEGDYYLDNGEFGFTKIITKRKTK